MMEQNHNTKIIEDFHKDQEPLIRLWLDKLALIGVLLVPLFNIIDYFLYEDYYRRFSIYRITASVVCILIFFINRKMNLGGKSYYLAIFGYYVVGLSILKMIIDVGGYSTPYYAGLNLVIVAFGVLFPVNARSILFHSISLYLIYIVSVLLINPAQSLNLDPTLMLDKTATEMVIIFIGNNAFLLSSLAIIIIASTVNHNLRFREYKNRIELQEAKKKLQEYSAQLENTVAKKDQDLLFNIEEKKKIEEHKEQLEEQLIQSQKMEAVGRMAGGIAHDFNNILTVISGYSDILLNQMKLEDPNRERVKAIRSASSRAASLIKKLSTFSRRQEVNAQIINLNSIVMNMKDMIRRLIGEDIELQFHLDDSLGNIKVDPNQMEQVIMNLVVNARDAMPKGGMIEISTSDFTDNKVRFTFDAPSNKDGYVVLSVKDTGCGMDEETQMHIFEPFYSTKEVGKGTGLGLSTVYGIIKQSEGFIQVSSEVNVGTTFKVILPVQDSQLTETVKQETSVTADKGIETIMLVEDDVYIRSMAYEILTNHGYKVLNTEDCNEALQIGKKYPYKIDLLLSDVIMPKWSGPELANQLYSIIPDLKVLFMSGYTGDALSKLGINEADINLLEKPFTTQSLLQKVREMLDEKPVNSQ